MPLVGRRSERAELDRLLTAARDGSSSALVVRGAPGIGKTTLLDWAADRAQGCRVVRVAGAESEMELAYAALQQMCEPLLERAGGLPEPQRDALATALGTGAGTAPDRFLVGLATLGLFAAAAEDRPLVCLVDDAQWLDRASAQALAFVARRLSAESVALLFAAREPGDELAVLPTLDLRGLAPDDARSLLGAAVPGPLDARVRDRVVAETAGNPLALLELPKGLSPAELTAGLGLPATEPLTGRIEESFERRFAALPEDSRGLLRIAAAEPLGNPSLVLRAAERLGIAPAAAGPAQSAGLIAMGLRVTFRHPLVRSAVYGAATPAEQREVHLALAAVTDADRDPDRHTWHRAQAADGPDEDVAQDLERAAGRAQARGGQAAAAALLERAAALTQDAALNAVRSLAAAQATHLAGAPGAALRLIAQAEAGQLDDFDQARALLLRGQVAFAARRGDQAPLLLLEAARRLEPHDVRMARDTYLEALLAAVFAGRLAAPGGSVRDAARAAQGSPPADPVRPPDLLLDGVSALVLEGYEAGAPRIKQGVAEFRAGEVTAIEELRWLWLACHCAILLWDYDSWDALTTRMVERVRGAGLVSALPVAISSRVGVHLNAGELDAGEALAEEIAAITEATGVRLAPYGALALSAWRGDEPAARELIASATRGTEERSEGMGMTVIGWTTAVLMNGLGRYGEALAAAEEAHAHPEDLWGTLWLHELIEAAVLGGRPERAAEAIESLGRMSRASGTDWSLGLDARCRALVAADDEAEGLYHQALELLGRTRVRIAVARTHLLYGEWLGRTGRAADARRELTDAHAAFTAVGAAAFAERAARTIDLAPAGAAPAAGPELTAQEGQIARLAREGLSNPEIGARLFISPRTVEYHLHKVFTKLAIASRGELSEAL